MRKHQRYLPVRDRKGGLLPRFVVIVNGSIDPDTVRAGNEAVLRARYEDAAFFFRLDRKATPAQLRERLSRLVFADKLGSMLERADRIAALAKQLADQTGAKGKERQTLDRACQLVKFDLGTQIVTELTSLAGTMAREYALAAGEPAAVADALAEVEMPRQAGGPLPESAAGSLLSLADRLDFLTGLAATVGLPTGSSDPFALRRAGLGALAVMRHHPKLATVSLAEGLRLAAAQQPVEVAPQRLEEISDFLAKRLEQQLTDEGHAIDDIRAVLVHADVPAAVDRALEQLARLKQTADFQRVAEAVQRSRRIVPQGTAPSYEPGALTEPAEVALHGVLVKTRQNLGGTADLAAFVAGSGELSVAVSSFFDNVFVMAEEPELRQARLGLLASVAELGRPVLAWEHLRIQE
jgi:glycyl-tRNA synthetase